MEKKYFRKFVKNLRPNFSHIYVEDDASSYPLTKLILSKFLISNIIKINHYKDIFNRRGQDFQLQKSSMNLILAKKKEPFLYPASEMVQEYDTPNTFYNTPILNCLYNCDYCFLQGMYDSGNIVIFVNEDDLMNAIDKKADDREDPSKPMVVSISYNTDILALENIIPLTERWINFAKKRHDVLIEVRTKSANFNSIKHIGPVKNVILSWTLSPQYICDRYEHGTPPLKYRVKALKNAIVCGWTVRICFDPIILIDNWYELYSCFLRELFTDLDISKIKDVTLGVFRMNKDYFKRILKREVKSDLYYDDYSVENGTIVIESKQRDDALNSIEDVISEFIPKSKILTWR